MKALPGCCEGTVQPRAAGYVSGARTEGKRCVCARARWAFRPCEAQQEETLPRTRAHSLEGRQCPARSRFFLGWSVRGGRLTQLALCSRADQRGQQPRAACSLRDQGEGAAVETGADGAESGLWAEQLVITKDQGRTPGAWHVQRPCHSAALAPSPGQHPAQVPAVELFLSFQVRYS